MLYRFHDDPAGRTDAALKQGAAQCGRDTVPAKQLTECLGQVTCGNCRRSLVGAMKVTQRAWETFVDRGGKT